MIKIGIIVTDLYDYYQQTFLDAFEIYCKDRDIMSYVFVGGYSSDYFESDGNSFLSLICNSRLDVILTLSQSLSSLCGLDTFHKFIRLLPKVPIISVGLKIPGIDSIMVDDKIGVSELMDHLIVVHGIKRIAFIKGPELNYYAMDRFDAYKTSLKRHNIPYDYKLVAPGNFSPGDGRKGLSLIIDVRKESFDAVFCCHDLSAFEVIRSLNERGMKVPGDISVVGFDNLDISSSFSPSLTTISQPFFNIGLMAGKYVENIVTGIKNQKAVVVDTKVIIRESCGCKRSIIFEPVYNEKLNNYSFEESVERGKQRILERSRFPYDIGNIGILLETSIDKIAESILFSVRNRETTHLIQTIEHILSEDLVKQPDASFWKFALEEFFISICENCGNKENGLFISSLLSGTLLMLYETEKRIHGYTRIDDTALIQYMSSIGDLLLTSKNEAELNDVLKRHLPNLKIRNCFIILYTDEKDIGELFFSASSHQYKHEMNHKFNISSILPDNSDSGRELSYMVIPLKVDEKELGYILIEIGDTPNAMFSFIAEKVSYGFKNIFLIKRMNSYTLELETAVEERTRELRLVNNQLKERSLRDSMTGLYNRRFLEEVLIPKSEKLVNQSDGRYEKSGSYGIILVDMDHFKLVNDVYGHASGDIVIKELGKTFKYLVRPEDYIIRLGGEEFLLVLRQFDGKYLGEIVSKILRAVRDKSFFMANGDKISKTCSLGAMVFPGSASIFMDFKSAIAIIDKCLYTSKDRGRDRGTIIDIISNKFDNSNSNGFYIINNFYKCVTTKKIRLIECKD